MKGLAARKLSVEILVKVEVDKAYVNLALAAAFSKHILSERDRAFTTFLVQGVIRHRDELDGEIAAIARQPLNKLTPAVRNLLRMAVFQLKYANDIPQSAVLNTATEIGKKVGHEGIARFVTGVLRSYLRTNTEIAQPQDGGRSSISPPEKAQRRNEIPDSYNAHAGSSNAGTAVAEAAAPESASGTSGTTGNITASGKDLAKKYTIPEWLVERWLKTYGAEITRRLLIHSQSIPDLSVRVCESGVTVDAVMNIFKTHGIKFHQGRLVPSCLIIEDRGHYKGPIDKLPGYNDGLFIVQDEAAAFPALILAAKAGETVVDLCAAPGGKTVQIAEMMENTGRVIAVDLHAHRLELLKQNRQRVGLTNIETVEADGTAFAPDIAPDKVLLDAPCTGTGVINRRSDIRFKQTQPDSKTLIDLQRRLLDNAASILKPGGVLVYSTCSIEPEENEQNIQWFLSQHKDFQLDPLTPFVADSSKDLLDIDQLNSGWIQLLPSPHKVSGFFIARLIKENYS